MGAASTACGSLFTMRTLPSASVISSSEMFDSDTRSISVFSLRRSMCSPTPVVVGAAAVAIEGERPGSGRACRLALRAALERMAQGKAVSIGAQPDDHALGEIGKIRM